MTTETLLVGRGRALERVPAAPWREQLQRARDHMRERLAFMTADHQAVRYAAVRLLPGSRAPLSAARLAKAAGLPESRTAEIVAELHRRLFFLVRNRAGRVSWAFPVTIDRTPHRLTFSTGERLWGA